jgi:hypothetical protein
MSRNENFLEKELLKRLQDRHVDCAEAVAKKAAADAVSTATVDPDTPNVLQAMMLFQQVKNRKMRRKSPTRLLCRRRRTTMLLKKRCKSCNG